MWLTRSESSLLSRWWSGNSAARRMTSDSVLSVELRSYKCLLSWVAGTLECAPLRFRALERAAQGSRHRAFGVNCAGIRKSALREHFFTRSAETITLSRVGSRRHNEVRCDAKQTLGFLG